MFKRFVLGFALGLGLMYYYLHHGEQVSGEAQRWGGKAASGYRGDKSRQLADEVLEKRKQQ